MKLTFRTRTTGSMADPQSKNMSRVACKAEVVVQHKSLHDSERASAMVTRCSMHGRTPAQMHPHETSRKTNVKPRVAWSQVSRFGTTGNRVLNVCTRTKINRSSVSIMDQMQEGWLAAGEKSLRKSTSTRALLPAMSSIALETRAVHSGLKLLRTRSRCVLVSLEIQCQLRRAVHWKGAASEPQCTIKVGMQRLSLMCKIQKTIKVKKTQGVEFPRKWHTKLCPKNQQSQHHIPLETCLKNAPTIKISKRSPNAQPENGSKNCSQKEIHSLTLHDDTTLG